MAFLLLGASMAAPGAQGPARLSGQRRALDRSASELRGARVGLEATRNELRSAEGAHLKATRTLQAARHTATQLHAAEMGLTGAIAERDTAVKELNTTREAVTQRLTSRTDYKAAVQQADDASKRLVLARANPSLDAARRERLVTDLTASVRLPTELLHQWLAEDTKLREATRRWETAEQNVVRLQPQVARAVEGDPEVVQARDKLKTAETALEKARKDALQAQKDLSTAQANLDRETRQYQQSVARERAPTRSSRRSRR